MSTFLDWLADRADERDRSGLRREVRPFKTGELVDLEMVAATRLKNEPAGIIDRVVAGRAVAITRHASPRAVILSYEDFQALAQGREPSLDALGAAVVGAGDGPSPARTFVTRQAAVLK